jgi:AcrR family transcriptional regulator
MKTVKHRSSTENLPPAFAGGSTAKPGGGKATAPLVKPKPRDPLATRRALIDAAAAIFRREGYFATDSNAIARAAGYAPGSFYNHFADKTAILLAVYDHYVELEWRGVREATTQSPRPNLPPASAGGSTSGIAQRSRTRGGQTAASPDKRIALILDFIESLHSEWARFRTDLRTVARLEPQVARALATSRSKQIDMLASLSGLSRAKHGPLLLTALALVERYADLLAEAKTLALPAAAVKRELSETMQHMLVAKNRHRP